MRPDLLVVRHGMSGAVELLAQKVTNCAVLNAGDGRHEHPTQALLDALTIRRAKGRLHRLTVAICGDIAHSRVARSNILLLNRMENRVRLIGPPTLMPAGIDALRRARSSTTWPRACAGADVVMMLRLQRERMDGGFVPSEREYYHRYGLDAEKLAHAAPDAIVMHPGPDEPRRRDRRHARRRHQPQRHPDPGRDGRGGAHGGDGPAGANLRAARGRAAMGARTCSAEGRGRGPARRGAASMPLGMRHGPRALGGRSAHGARPAAALAILTPRHGPGHDPRPAGAPA